MLIRQYRNSITSNRDHKQHVRKSKIFITTLWVLTLKYIWRVSILSTRWYLNNIYCNTVCWNADRACCTCIACAYVYVCERQLTDSQVLHCWNTIARLRYMSDRVARNRVLRFVTRAIMPHRRKWNRKENVRLPRGNRRVRIPLLPASFLLTFSGRSASAEIRVSRAKIEELSQIDVSIIDRKICLSTHYSDKRYVFNFKKYLILLKNSQNVSHQAVFLHSL